MGPLIELIRRERPAPFISEASQNVSSNPSRISDSSYDGQIRKLLAVNVCP